MTPTAARVAAAWGVHLLTASGVPAGILAILAIQRGDGATALWWMAYTFAVDCVDGTLARAVGVKRVLPFVDGTRLDDIVDYFTYVVVPAFFLLGFDLLPAAVALPVGFCPVLASAYGFSRTDAKTTDHFFTGFPSYWNVVAYYLFVLGWPPMLNAAIVVTLAVGVFVPIRYVYPSRMQTLQTLTIALGLVWAAALLYGLVVIGRTGTAPYALMLVSLAFPMYYVGLSIALDARTRSASA